MQYVAFLRGMNLGGRRITNEKLCACFHDLGFGNVWAFLASGNVVFDAAGAAAPQDRIAQTLEVGLRSALGYDVPTFLRSADEVAAIAAADPFESTEGAAGGKLQVALLRSAPAADACERALSLASAEDRLALDDRTLFWLPAGRLTDSALDVRGLDAALGPMTMRTQRTLQRLARKLAGGSSAAGRDPR